MSALFNPPRTLNPVEPKIIQLAKSLIALAA